MGVVETTNPIKILIVEDDPDWVRSITTFLHLQPDMLVVGAALSGEEAVRLAASLSYDIALIDFHLSEEGLNGVQTALELNELKPARFIMLTSERDERRMTDAFTAGAYEYLDKARFRELAQTIRSVHHHPEAMDALHKELKRLKREEQLSSLTPAEREIFERIEQGQTHAEMEKQLVKAESTLKNQINKILKKLGVKSGREAVEKVRRNGIGKP
ncbi:two component transcriptional regulator, LuxR family [Paenibacillus curdlanolyticus YK9]|uniref:Two component transcriptional regulator, LuxR family n=1 Tax=Paenibacillus curdlanolyticus YK9 TaxID=717606 RepID=E0I657_9BACL|nr:response regulator transcription factor [Paenibacillus curdlanolyticus]EFM12449.1 two component transcriptional regulator, LuxR family [Paenibacillus curdlanolyticus YK9]